MNFLFEQDIIVTKEDLLKLQCEKEYIEKEIIGKQAILDFLIAKQKEVEKSNLISSSTNNSDIEKNNYAPTKKITLIDRVDDIISHLDKDKEFDSASVYDALLETDKIDSSTSKSSISKVLSKFLEQGKIKVTFQGSGKIANRYKVNVNKPDNAEDGFNKNDLV